MYILSKGRARERKTARLLDHIRVPYHVVIEPQDEADYAAVIPREKLLVMDKNDEGISYVRNFIWEHSISIGAERHWQLDDDIEAFIRVNENAKVPLMSGTFLKLMEDYVDRYENVGQAGTQYTMFVPRKRAWKYPPIYLNQRVYSCTLNRNDVPYRYRTRLNEDTDMSLQFLKGGWCTVLFNQFLSEMSTTMTQEGGQTDIYVESTESVQNLGRLKMARKLVELHPDVTSIYWRWGRWQHMVDYRPFRANKLKPKPGLDIKPGFDEHGLVLEHLVNGKWERGHEMPTKRRGA